MSLLVLNVGSSSLKYGLYDCEKLTLLQEGSAECASGDSVAETCRIVLVGLKEQGALTSLVAIGHRIVYGGDLCDPTDLGSASVMQHIESFNDLAPEHNPPALLAVKLSQLLFPNVKNFACFDTAFHTTIPRIASTLALPKKYSTELKVSGFHGLSVEFISDSLASSGLGQHKVVVAHLGHGSSLTALNHGRSVDTTMSASPLGGLPQSTRSGDLDPSVPLFLLTKHGQSPASLRKELGSEAGLVALHPLGSDMRALEKAAAGGDVEAEFALAFFSYHLAKHLAALVVSLGGLEVLIFTAGIGEHSFEVRERVCQHLGWLGVELDVEANRRGGNATTISASASKVLVRVIATDEQIVIARHCKALLSSSSSNKAGCGRQGCPCDPDCTCSDCQCGDTTSL